MFISVPNTLLQTNLSLQDHENMRITVVRRMTISRRWAVKFFAPNLKCSVRTLNIILKNYVYVFRLGY